MTWQADGVKKVKKRTYILASCMFCFSMLLFSRMVYLQVIEGQKYQTLADKNRIASRQIASDRGLIVDRNGENLASNRISFRAIITAEDTEGNVQNVLDNFRKIVPLDDAEMKRILKEIKQKRSFQPVRLKEDLSFEQMASVQLNIPELPGIAIEEGLMRVYPEKEKTAHIVGYVSFLTEEDLKEKETFQVLPDVRIGRIGLERSFENELAGVLGTRKMEINSIGREVRELDREEPIAGEDIQLSIDKRLQEIGFAAMKDETGSAVLMDIYTGEVLMLVSTPSFDANIFNYPISPKLWKELNQNDRHPMLNKATAGAYSPGSVFKIVVALAGLDAGVISSETEIECTGRLLVGSHPFHCWKKGGHGSLNLTEALQHSCDIYFYELARKVGVDKIVETAKKLGYGSKTGIELASERSGLLPTREWKLNRYDDAWRLGDTMNMGIGQGFLLSTPMQMLQMMARVANGGYKVSPTLLKYPLIDEENRESLGFKDKHLKDVMKGLSAVVNKYGGTAYHTRLDVDGQKMGGKTASTQIRHISLAEREEGLKQQHELAWKDRDHAFFVAYAPLNKPRYALVVAVEHGGGGGMVAAPIASNIMRHILELEIEDKKNALLKTHQKASELNLKDKPKFIRPVYHFEQENEEFEN